MPLLRLAEPADAPAVGSIYAPVVAGTAISFEVEPPDAREMESRIAAALGFAPWLVCCEDGEVAGYAYAARHREREAYRWSVDVSVYVREGRRRGGVGCALYGSLFALLRLQGFCAAHAGIMLPNDASVGLHETLGFRPVGVYRKVGFKLGAWYDVGWWQLDCAIAAGHPRPRSPWTRCAALRGSTRLWPPGWRRRPRPPPGPSPGRPTRAGAPLMTALREKAEALTSITGSPTASVLTSSSACSPTTSSGTCARRGGRCSSPTRISGEGQT